MKIIFNSSRSVLLLIIFFTCQLLNTSLAWADATSPGSPVTFIADNRYVVHLASLETYPEPGSINYNNSGSPEIAFQDWTHVIDPSLPDFFGTSFQTSSMDGWGFLAQGYSEVWDENGLTSLFADSIFDVTFTTTELIEFSLAGTAQHQTGALFYTYEEDSVLIRLYSGTEIITENLLYENIVYSSTWPGVTQDISFATTLGAGDYRIIIQSMSANPGDASFDFQGTFVSVVDNDGDTYTAPQDCNDEDASINPDATETPYDGIDQNCDGYDNPWFDADGDGYENINNDGSILDCNDENPGIYPGATEIPYDGIDQNCDGVDLNDIDMDGSEFPLDCDDNDPNIFPLANEVISDGIDQDCNGYDLTTVITKATYSVKKRTLNVIAQSSLDRANQLFLEGYGEMTYSKRHKAWSIKVSKLATAPATVTVTSVEGTTTAATTMVR